MFPPNHPVRLALAKEVTARRPEPVTPPARASYVAVKIDAADRAREQAHLAGLCQRHGVIPPAADATHFRCDIGAVRLKWERHGEFSGYLCIVADPAPRPFPHPPKAPRPGGRHAAPPRPPARRPSARPPRRPAPPTGSAAQAHT